VSAADHNFILERVVLDCQNIIEKAKAAVTKIAAAFTFC
jgi:hypothetical protein